MAPIIAQTVGSSLVLASRTLSKRISCIQDSNNLWYYIIYFIEKQILVLNPNVYTFTIYIKFLRTAKKVDESGIKAEDCIVQGRYYGLHYIVGYVLH